MDMNIGRGFAYILSWMYSMTVFLSLKVAGGSVHTFLKGESPDLSNSTFAVNDI